jgi:alkylation response protein AidB-like acyl-CoA dehydrogenase
VVAIEDRPAQGSSAASEFIDVPWALNEEHLAWRQVMRDFCREVVAPSAGRRSAEKDFDVDLVRAVGELGVFSLLLPGGSGDLRSVCIALEELAAVDGSLAVTVHVQAMNTTMFELFTRDRPDLREPLLSEAARGDALLSFALTEPSGGSDAGNVATRAVRHGDAWVINGSKQFITNCGTPRSRVALVFAATGEQPGTDRPKVSLFLVPLDREGVTVAPGYDKLGWRASDTHPLFFDDVRVPASALIGEEGAGYRKALNGLTFARIPFAAMGLGLARSCLDETLTFASGRESFGRPLGSHSSYAAAVSDMAADVALARLAVYDAAWKYDQGVTIDREAAVAKLTVTELANKVAYAATQLHGGYGFIRDSVVTRHYEDARVLTIAEGTSEIQRLLIARHLGLGR